MRLKGAPIRIAMATVLVATGLGLTPASSTAQTPSPQTIGLQASDVPGFSPVDPSVETFQDPNDQGIDQAFIQCAQSIPLLGEFDTGPQATVSQVYGQGMDPYGTPTLAVGTAVFTDGSAADAYTAYSALAGSTFQHCWASAYDSLNQMQGFSTPITPTTVTALTTPTYGSGSTGFDMDSDYSVEGQAVQGQFETSVIVSGSIVTVLFTTAYETTFPESVRLSVLANIARRMGAAATNPSPVSVVPSGPTSTTTSSVPLPPRITPPPSPDNASCGPNVSLSISPEKLETLNNELEDSGLKLPVSVAGMQLPLDLVVAPSLDPGSFTFCSDGITAALRSPPWSDPASSLSVDAGSSGQYGPFTYSSVLAGWTQLDKSTPRDQTFSTKFDLGSLVPDIDPSFGVDFSKDGPSAELTVAEISLASAQVSLDLLVGANKALTVDLGPTLTLNLEIKKQELVKEAGEELAEGEDEQAVANELGSEIADDDAAAAEAEGEGFYGLTPAQIEKQVEDKIGPQLIEDFNEWFAGLQAGGADAQALEDEGVTADEVPSDAASALGGETAGGGDFVVELGCDVLFGGPEDPVGDAACFG